MCLDSARYALHVALFDVIQHVTLRVMHAMRCAPCPCAYSVPNRQQARIFVRCEVLLCGVLGV